MNRGSLKQFLIFEVILICWIFTGFSAVFIAIETGSDRHVLNETLPAEGGVFTVSLKANRSYTLGVGGHFTTRGTFAYANMTLWLQCLSNYSILYRGNQYVQQTQPTKNDWTLYQAKLDFQWSTGMLHEDIETQLTIIIQTNGSPGAFNRVSMLDDTVNNQVELVTALFLFGGVGGTSVYPLRQFLNRRRRQIRENEN
ncbi:MAG: hypothetical protein ACFFBD_10950 [Candidatus Hodarchaeota archaeon]